MSNFNPMLAAEGELGKILYPKVAMIKHNGVRGVHQGSLLARSLKPISNPFTRQRFGHELYSDMEGELVVGDPLHEDVFSITTSGVGSGHGEPDVKWFLFDLYHPTAGFMERLMMLEARVKELPADMAQHVEIPLYKIVTSDAELEEFGDWAIAQGYEGLVLRDPRASYKQGRSTQLEGGFMRFCPWLRSEAKILTIEEGKVNNNVSKVNELGFLKKSTHKANMVGSGAAGSVMVEDVKTKLHFNIAVPTEAMQKEVWENPDNFLNKFLKYKYKPPVKKGGKPRFPQWEGIRDPIDMVDN